MNLHSNNAEYGDVNLKLLQKNIASFSRRFPELSKNLGIQKIHSIEQLFKILPKDYSIFKSSKRDALTLQIKSTTIHSKYDPIKESQRILSGRFFQEQASRYSCVFLGLGLGYIPELYAQNNPQAKVIIVEPNSAVFLCFLASRELDHFFRHKALSLVIGAKPAEVFSFLKASKTIDSPRQILQPEKEIYAKWFAELDALFDRQQQNIQINKNTLKNFGTLWLKNLSKNINFFEELCGINIFADAFKGLPAIVLAAGPSLTSSLQCIAQQQIPALIIATDTALKACLRFKIQPDFVLLFDPQYWNFLHIVRNTSPQSVLVGDITVYPAVLRQKFKSSLLMSSPHPLAQVLEAKIDTKGRLETGGSVATTAWDFARFLGASEIIMLGLDLAFPNKQTHFFGSTFEEKAHQTAQRNAPAETTSVSSLYSAQPEYRPAHTNTNVLTDQRMLLYSWWFEHHVAKESAPPTTSLLSKGIIINGIKNINETKLYAKLSASPMTREAIQKKIDHIITSTKVTPKQTLTTVVENVCRQLTILQKTSQKALSPTNTAQQKDLAKINSAIKNNIDSDLLAAVLFYLQENENSLQANSPTKLYRNIVHVCKLFLANLQ